MSKQPRAKRRGESRGERQSAVVRHSQNPKARGDLEAELESVLRLKSGK